MTGRTRRRMGHMPYLGGRMQLDLEDPVGLSAGPEANALAVILISGSALLLPRVYRHVRYHL